MGGRAVLGAIAVAAVVSASGMASAADPVPTRFSDVDDDRFFTEPIAWAQSTGVVTGYTEHCFLPDAAATRAEVVTVIHRALDSPAPTTDHAFTDLTGSWQEAPVGWAAETGVTTGTTATTFDPSRAATRAEVAAFVWRAAGRPPPGPVPFVAVIRDWQRPAVGWMAANEITTGRSPTGPRGQSPSTSDPSSPRPPAIDDRGG